MDILCDNDITITLPECPEGYDGWIVERTVVPHHEGLTSYTLEGEFEEV